MSTAPKPSPTARTIRRVGTVLLLLVAGLAAVSAPATAAEPTFSAGPGGLPPGADMAVQSITPCPAPPGAGSWYANVAFVQAGGELSYVDIPVATDGTWVGDIVVPFDATPGDAELQAVCFDGSHHAVSTLTYHSVDRAVGGTKAAFAAASVSSSAQSPLAVRSLTPCPEPMSGHGWTARVELVENTVDGTPSSYRILHYGFYPVDADGNWSGTFDLPLGVLAGPAYLVASCYYSLGPDPDSDDVYYQPIPTTIEPATASLSAKSLSFGSVRLGRTSAARTVTVTNHGGAPLTVTGVALVGANAADFQITHDTCADHVLLSGVSCSTSVTFRPGADASRTATLKYTDTAASSPQYVALSGRGCRLLLGPFCL